MFQIQVDINIRK